MNNVPPKIVLCNGADLPTQWADSQPLVLDYRESGDINPNIKLSLPNFVAGLLHLPSRVLDLLEIAAYVFSADRLIFRGSRAKLEYHSWSRTIYFAIRVRDFEFWDTPSVKERLKETLAFMSGDREFQFIFQPGHSTPRVGPFNTEAFEITRQPNIKAVLFSGGLDSLAGIVERLENSSDHLCLVSHRSGQPKTARTQNQLFTALRTSYPTRISHYQFHCSLRGTRAREETQRTRAFLYTSIAYALSHAHCQREILLYENGVTSINFLKRQDQINARASRTTHPKTIALLESLFSDIDGSDIVISTPFLWKTKADIFHILAKNRKRNLITSTVSCSETFQNLNQATHCGGCSQCIDRRFASYAAKLDDVDEGGIYAFDFVRNPVEKDEINATLLDYVGQARGFANWNLAEFSRAMFSELINLVGYLPGIASLNDEEQVKKIWNLCRNHGRQVGAAILRMRHKIEENPNREILEGSFHQMIANTQYFAGVNLQTNGVKVFYSYSHKDERWRTQFENHLSLLRRQRLISEWHDRKIGPGEEWRGQICEHLNNARIILLLVSADFMASDYCYDVEMTRAMNRHRAGEARVIPIILRSVDWEEAPFGDLQALPTDGRSIKGFRDRDKAFTHVAKEIRKVVKELIQA